MAEFYHVSYACNQDWQKFGEVIKLQGDDLSSDGLAMRLTLFMRHCSRINPVFWQGQRMQIAARSHTFVGTWDSQHQRIHLD